MEHIACRLLLLPALLLVNLRVSICCILTPVCEQADSLTLKEAIENRNRAAVCNILPVYMKCLQDTLDKCGEDTSFYPAEETDSSKMNNSQILDELKMMKTRHRNMCTDDWYYMSENGKCSYIQLSHHIALLKILIFFHGLFLM